MRIIILGLCLLAAAGCTRPSAGYSFVDLVSGASTGLAEYETWVRVEEAKDPFPNRLCLAGIYFDVSLAETTGASANVGLPLAGPIPGATSVLGVDLTYSDTTTGTVVVPVVAQYPGRPKERTAEDWASELTAFLSEIPDLRNERMVLKRRPGTTRPPQGVSESSFANRTDLAAELWRIRQALHDMVLASPFDPALIGQGNNYLLAPGELVFSLSYTVTESQKGTASVKVGPAEGSGSVGRGASDASRMVLVYLVNNHDDQMRCYDDSIDMERFAALRPGGKLPSTPPTP